MIQSVFNFKPENIRSECRKIVFAESEKYRKLKVIISRKVKQIRVLIERHSFFKK
jgi:hypothetical protein